MVLNTANQIPRANAFSEIDDGVTVANAQRSSRVSYGALSAIVSRIELRSRIAEGEFRIID